MNTIIELNKFNGVKFQSKNHLYTSDDDNNNIDYTSVTTVVGEYAQDFPTAFIAPKSAAKFNREKEPWEDEKTAEDILLEWDFKRIHSTTEGSIIHDFAENLWNNKIVHNDSDYLVDMEQFPEYLFDLCGDMNKTLPIMKGQVYDYYEKNKKHLISVVAEFIVYDEDYKVAGMIDKIFYDTRDNMLHIYDWKTSADIEKKNKYSKKMKSPFGMYQDSNFYHYSLQLSIYKHILEKNTNLKFGNSKVVWFNEENESAQEIEMINIDVEKILKKRAKKFES